MRDLEQKLFSMCLNIDEGKIVFEALAELPFKYVYELIGKLNSQLNASPTHGSNERALYTYTLSRHELNLMIRALGELPFNHVYTLVENLNAQIREQLDA